MSKAELATIPDSTVAMVDDDKFLAMIERLATSKDVDVEKMSAFLDLKERMMAKAAETAFNQAYARIVKIMPRVKKSGVVEYEDKKTGKMAKAFNFAKWEDMDTVIRPILLDEGFDLSFDTELKEGGGAIVVGKLSHIQGHSRTARVPLALDASGGKNNLQGMGSTLSYGKRYATELLLNIIREGEDDDGVRGGMVFIDIASQCHINALIEETKADRLGFLRFMGVAEVENIQVKDYAKAINALMMKRKSTQQAVQS